MKTTSLLASQSLWTLPWALGTSKSNRASKLSSGKLAFLPLEIQTACLKVEKGHVAFWHPGNASGLSTTSSYTAKEILPTKLTAAEGIRASSYTVLCISVVMTLIVLRFPSATLVRNPSQGMGNLVTGVMSSERWKTSILNTQRETIKWSQNELLFCAVTMTIKHMWRLSMQFSWVLTNILHFSTYFKIYKKIIFFSSKLSFAFQEYYTKLPFCLWTGWIYFTTFWGYINILNMNLMPIYFTVLELAARPF